MPGYHSGRYGHGSNAGKACRVAGTKGPSERDAPRVGIPRGPEETRGLPWPDRDLRRWLPALLIGVVIGVLVTIAIQQVLPDDSGSLPEFTTLPPPDSPDVTVTLSYDLISALIQRGIESGEIAVPLSNIRTGNSDGRLLIRGTFTILGQNVSGSVELEPFIENGALRTSVRRAQVGRLPVPSNLDRLAEGPLNRQLSAALGDLPATLTSVRVGERGITITADVRIDEIQFTPR